MSLDIPRHVKYWRRCFKSVLPHHYTPNDSNRLALGYFILAALDLLSSTSEPLIPSADRPPLRAWVLSLQHRGGGFCGSPHHVLPTTFRRGYDGELTRPTADDTENANIYATYFALLILGILGEDADAADIYRGIDRVAALRWLRRLQRPDGSFGEVVSADGRVGGGRDMRYCYMAATIRWILRGNEPCGVHREDLDFDIPGFVGHIRRSQTFDGGIAESSMGESHAGYAYCAVAALAMLDLAEPTAGDMRYLKQGIPDMASLAHWLVSRQFAYAGESDSEDAEGDLPDLSPLSVTDDKIRLTGYSGRLNKVADTCYTWYVSGALSILSSALPGFVRLDSAPARNFLLDITQHKILGGFGKHPDLPPDLYHSYLGLAALATMAGDEGEEGLGQFDVRLLVGAKTAARIESGRVIWTGNEGRDVDAERN